MSKRVWVVGGGFLAGLVLVGGLYELNRLVSDYSALSEPTASATSVAAAPLTEAPLEEAEPETARTDKAERRRLRRERRATGTAEVTGVVPGAPVVADGRLQAVSTADLRAQLRPDQLSSANRPDAKAIRRRARLHRRGTRIAPTFEIGTQSLGGRVPGLSVAPAAIEPE